MLQLFHLYFLTLFFPAIIIIFYQSARICSVWKKFRELSGVFVGKQGLSLKQQEKIYQCCDRPVLLSCCERWELTVMDEVRLYVVEHCVIKMMQGVILVDKVPTDVLWSRVGVVRKIEDMIIRSHLRCYGA